jgi:hypothetical protein
MAWQKIGSWTKQKLSAKDSIMVCLESLEDQMNNFATLERRVLVSV